MTFLKKYWFHIVFAFAVIGGSLLAHWSYETVVKGWSPTMIVDLSVPSETCPLGYEPVEVTGLDPSLGKVSMITCKVPASYVQYIHYPKNWDKSPFNPANPWAQAIKWALYGILAIVIGLLAWRITMIVRARRKANKPSSSGSSSRSAKR